MILTLAGGAALAGTFGAWHLDPGDPLVMDLNGDTKPDQLFFHEESDGRATSSSWSLIDGASGTVIGTFSGSLMEVRTESVGGWPVISTQTSLPSVYQHRMYTYVADPTYRSIYGIEPTNEALDEIRKLPGPPTPVAFPTLCEPGDTVFTCQTTNQKTLSVCRRDRGVVYRFGRPGTVELSISRDRSGADGTRPDHRIAFEKEGVKYEVTERWELQGRDLHRRGAAGVRVTRGDEVLAELSCGAEMFGTLGGL